MKFVAPILIILFVNKLLVRGEQIVKNTNFAGLQPQHPNSQSVEEKDHSHVEILPKEEINIPDMSRQISAYRKFEIITQKPIFESGEVSAVSAETQIDTTDEYEISSLSSTLGKDVLHTKIHPNTQNFEEEKLRGSFNQSWAENRAKTINEYKVATRTLSSDGTSQNTHLAESELIQIVLKEATNFKKQPEENNFSKEGSNFTTKRYEIDAILSTSSGPSALDAIHFQGSLTDTAGDSQLADKSVKEVINLGERLEEEAVSSKQGLVDTNAYGEGTDTTSMKQNFHVTNSGLEISDLEGLKNANKTQEDTTSRSGEGSFSLETTPIDADELTTTTPNSLKQPQTLNEPAFNGTLTLNGTQEQFLGLTNAAPAAADESHNTKIVWEDAVLKEVSSLNKTQEDAYWDARKPSAATDTTLFATTDFSLKPFNQNFTQTENELKEAVSLETRNANDFNLKGVSSPIEANVLTQKPLNSDKETHDCSGKVNDLAQKATSLSDQAAYVSSTEALEQSATSSSSNIEFEKSRAAEMDAPLLTSENQQLPGNKQYLAESASYSSEEEKKQEAASSKPTLSLEEYAVNQMSFILDHLLLETQKFVANVLQATINSVFPRDRLKHYAEGVNQVLNPAVESDYSDEILETFKRDDPDEMYERIVEKLNFLKNKPSKYLQKQIPPEWLTEFQNKRAELAIWLDKAAEQMHKEFTDYITAEEEPIKYQYFNETFDDIYRATEIHHKLALLADLVKIIKNKKQITFMDLYMQT